MNAENLDNLLRRFRRRVNLIAAIRVAAVLAIPLLVAWSLCKPSQPDNRTALLIIGAVLLGWVILAIASIHLSRTLQMARVMLGTGQTDNARVWLGRVMTGLSLSPRIQMVACQHLASSFFLKEAYRETVLICSELLRYRLRRLKSLEVNVRLMLADSLLTLDRQAEAYQAMRPIHDLPLSLADRMKLLPLQLRYDLRTHQTASAIEALPEKVRIAELLDSQQAALVHAMLAEACKRRSMTVQADFLLRRARLYSDLEPLAQRYAWISTTSRS